MTKLLALVLSLVPFTLSAQSLNGIPNQPVTGNSSFITGAGSANVMTGCPTPSYSSASFVTGLVVHLRPNAANTTTTPTFNLCSLGATTIVKGSSGSLVALAASDYVTGVDATLYYTGSFWQLMNPQTATGVNPLSGMTATQVAVAASANTVTSSVAASTTVNGQVCALGSTCTISAGYPAAETHTASGATELDFTTCFSSSYQQYDISFYGMAITGSAALFGLQVHTGGSYDTTSGHYYAARNLNEVFGGSTVVQQAGVSGTLAGFDGANGTIPTGQVFSGHIYVSNPLGGTISLGMNGTLNWWETTSVSFALSGYWVYTPAAVVDGFRVYASGQTFNGTVTCQPIPH